VEVRLDQGGKMQEKETLDEKLPGLFEPDTLLPIQYFEAMRKKHLLEGEKRLILSVLEDAVECFMKCIDATTSKSQRLFRDADEWIALEDKHWVFSFDNVCEMLDINPEYLRRGLKQWKERKLEAIERAAAARAEAAANPPLVEAPAAEPELPTPAVTGPEAPRVSAKVSAPRIAGHKPATPAAARNASRNLRKARA
jgi:transposase-like protein